MVITIVVPSMHFWLWSLNSACWHGTDLENCVSIVALANREQTTTTYTDDRQLIALMTITDITVFYLWRFSITTLDKQSCFYHNICCFSAYTWLPIQLLLTLSLYLVQFLSYLTSNFSGFDLDLWPSEVNWGKIFLYDSKAQIWLPIWLLWTPSLSLSHHLSCTILSKVEGRTKWRNLTVQRWMS